MSPSDQRWQRLTAAARAAVDSRDPAAPYGFSTRVVALAWTQERMGSLLERFSWRALGVAALLTVISAAANYSVFTSNSAEEDTLGNDGAISALLDFSS